jgi:hypothetical protein
MTAPLIYSLVLPLVFLDLGVTVFQALTFRIHRRVRDEHSRYQRFLEYGDAESYRLRLTALRRDVSGRRRL